MCIRDSHRPAGRLERTHRGRELVLRDVLQPLVERQRDAVSRERALVLRAFGEQKPAGAVAQAAQLLDSARELVVQRILEAVLALAVRRDEAEQRAGKLTARVVAPAFALDEHATQRRKVALARSELAHAVGLFGRELALEPREAALRKDLLLDRRGIEAEHG